MATWYVRPDTSHSGTRNGTSYATAWGGWSEITWGGAGVVGGDTLYVCGTHSAGSNVVVGAHGASSDAARVTISGTYADAPGEIILAGVYFHMARAYTNLSGLSLSRTTSTSTILYVQVNNVTISDMDISGMGNGISLEHSSARTNIKILNNAIHDCVGTLGSSGRGIAMLASTASLTHSSITISGNEIYRCTDSALRLSVESAAWDTTSFNAITICDNRIHDCGANGILIRSGNGDTTTWPAVLSSGLAVENNIVYNCGTVAGASGSGGGISVSGFTAPHIWRNNVYDCFVTGAGIQTAKNVDPLIEKNTVYGIRSGTPTGSFQNGLPIDGNGIFIDNLTRGGVVRRNVIHDLITTGNTNSGTGLSFWNNTESATFESNLIYDCYRGGSYGNDVENGNRFIGNTFVNCDIGISKVGTDILTGNLIVKNNLFVDCPVAFSGATNPGVTWDYNAYVGTLDGISSGANDITADPLLTSTYRPMVGSPLLQAGTFISYASRDINGVQRPNPPSIGAYDVATMRIV